MTEQKTKPSEDGSYDMTKIYTPHRASAKSISSAANCICDNAPVRIYERPVRKTAEPPRMHCDLF